MSDNNFKFGVLVLAVFIVLVVSLSTLAIVKTYTEHDMAKLKFMAEYEKRCRK